VTNCSGTKAYFFKSLRHIEDFAFGVDGSPKVDRSAVDFQIDLVEMPNRVRLHATLS
jgi:hypothetical protein